MNFIYIILEKALSRLKGRKYVLDRRVPPSFLVGIFTRRIVWLLRGLTKTLLLQGRPAMVFIAPGVRLRNARMCRFGRGITLETGVVVDGLSAEGINVYEVRPGIIKTDMTAGVQEKYDKLIGEGLIPQHRWGTPEDVGRAVSSLVSGAFNYSTGTIIEVSGGMNIRTL